MSIIGYGKIKALTRYATQVDKSEALPFSTMQEMLGLRPELVGDPDIIPRSRPLVVVANHPYGIIDALSLAALLEKVRPDFKIFGGERFSVAADCITERLLPVGGRPGKTARQIRIALRHLEEGKCVAVFPGQQLSRPNGWGGTVIDDPWQPMAAALLLRLKEEAKQEAAFLPVFIEKHNSLPRHIASHLTNFPEIVSIKLQKALKDHKLPLPLRRQALAVHHAVALPRKFLSIQETGTWAKSNKSFVMHVGRPYGKADLPDTQDSKELVAFMQKATQALGPALPSRHRRSPQSTPSHAP